MASSQCCENPPDLSSTCGEGHIESFQHMKAYTTGSPDSKAALLLISDVFGFEAPNLRKLADKVAAAGYFVVVPDYFHGDYYDLDKPIEEWIKSHGPEKGVEESKPIISALKNKGISSIGAAGFCWGGKAVVELGKSNDIQAAVLCHASFVTVDDIKEIKCPIAILGAEIDRMSPPELVKQFEEILSANGADAFVKIFPGVSHGWTVRYSDDDGPAVKKAEEAHQDMLAWFTKYINEGSKVHTTRTRL